MSRVNPYIAVTASLALASCVVTPPPGPRVAASPGQGKSAEAFQQDDGACRQYAAQYTGITPQEAATNSQLGSAAIGTILGAGLGAAIGAAARNPGAGAAIGAGAGALVGTSEGARAGAQSAANVQGAYDASYSQCMTARGNTVTQVAAAPPPRPAYVYAQPRYYYPPPPPYYYYPYPRYYYPYPY